jgi:hypothetical protein
MWARIPTFVRDPQGRILVNPKKQFIQPFELGIDNPNETVVLNANQQRGPFPMTAQYDGPIEIFYVKVVVKDDTNTPLQTYNIDWLLEHPGKRKIFMNRFPGVPLLATAGDAGRPYVLPETIFIPPIQSLNVSFQNNDGAERRVQLVLGGIKYYPNSAPEAIRQEMWSYIQRRERTYTYWLTTNEAVNLTAAQVGASANSTIPDDADFECFKLSAQSTGAFNFRIRDGQNDRGLSSAKFHSSVMFGGHIPTAMGGGIGGSGGCFPYRWPTTFIVRRSVQMRYEFDDLSGAPNEVKIVLGGRKISYG